MKKRALHIGQSIPRADALAKATGMEKYAGDYGGPDFLWAGVKRAGIPHGRIREIRTDKASALPGVIAVLTHRDIKGTNRQGVIRKDQPVLADDKVRHRGDGVALVVADNKESLRRALDCIELDLDPLPSVLDPEAAALPDAPLVHEDNPQGNTLLHGRIETGASSRAFETCAVIAEGRFALPHQDHACLETESGWAVRKENGRIEITCSTQTPFRDRTEVAHALGLDMQRIRIITAFCGGAFGRKDGVTIQSLLALAALHCPGRPVKMCWSREESMIAGAKRHPAVITCRLGADAGGMLQALDMQILFDTGPYDHLGGAVLALGMEHAGGPYRIPNVNIEARAVYTNNPVSGAFRGFGVPQVLAVTEQLLDMAAAQCGLSPMQIRLANALAQGDKNPIGATMTTSTAILDCLDAIQNDPVWKEREQWKSEAGPFKTRGIGIAAVMHGMGYGPSISDSAGAKIELTGKGQFQVYGGVVDMGQGNANTYLQIAGDLLNQDMDHMELVLPDTDRTLPSGSASASRTTYTFGNALISATRLLKERILNRVADMLFVQGPEALAMVPGAVRHLASGKELTLADAARFMTDDERIAIAQFKAPVSQDVPTEDRNLRMHGIPHHIFSYAAHLAGVEIDRLTGAVEVLHYVTANDCGSILNPQLFEQQMQGGVSQGIGYALYEDFIMNNGAVLTRDFSTYIIPTSMDVPDMTTIAIAQPEHTGPFGLKGAGEIAIDAPLPAIANAVADACGCRLARYPLTQERILLALAESS